MSTANVSIRMDKQVKQDADALFASMGMTMSTAVNIFVRESLRTGTIPFIISGDVPNARLVTAMEEAEKIARDPNEPSYKNAAELFAALDSED